MQKTKRPRFYPNGQIRRRQLENVVAALADHTNRRVHAIVAQHLCHKPTWHGNQVQRVVEFGHILLGKSALLPSVNGEPTQSAAHVGDKRRILVAQIHINEVARLPGAPQVANLGIVGQESLIRLKRARTIPGEEDNSLAGAA